MNKKEQTANIDQLLSPEKTLAKYQHPTITTETVFALRGRIHKQKTGAFSTQNICKITINNAIHNYLSFLTI